MNAGFDKEKATFWSVKYYEQLKKCIEDYETDFDQSRRIEERNCKTCYYLKKPGVLHAFTKWYCLICDKEGLHPDSGTPHYCNDCSDNLHICIRCGSDI
ncbi:hypothetical protein [Bacillus sp. Brlt_9]|uniref:hypothetical protein n=1 Tax=Bacillus sp. Brlt_9 TaxID=3110916 RepID=UPI003F7B6B1A